MELGPYGGGSGSGGKVHNEMPHWWAEGAAKRRKGISSRLDDYMTDSKSNTVFAQRKIFVSMQHSQRLPHPASCAPQVGTRRLKSCILESCMGEGRSCGSRTCTMSPPSIKILLADMFCVEMATSLSLSHKFVISKHGTLRGKGYDSRLVHTILVDVCNKVVNHVCNNSESNVAFTSVILITFSEFLMNPRGSLSPFAGKRYLGTDRWSIIITSTPPLELKISTSTYLKGHQVYKIDHDAKWCIIRMSSMQSCRVNLIYSNKHCILKYPYVRCRKVAELPNL
ncbi:hypothetical protein ZWY2020_011192 [Hordeum vulgare]|nr:hypothetical protein ZWY2020_011192 [Hordeum vulgare]